MDEPQLTLTDQERRMQRYADLNQRDMAYVTVRCLKRLGVDVTKIAPRRLTLEEAEQLTDADFEWRNG